MSHTSLKTHEVYTLTQPAELRFKLDQTIRSSQIPTSPRSPKVFLSNLFALCSRRKDRFVFPDTPQPERPLRIKFVDKINNECIILGNEREIDVLILTVVKEECCVDTRLVGKINPSFDVNSVRVERKSTIILYLENLVMVAGTYNVAVYFVDFKKDQVYL